MIGQAIMMLSMLAAQADDSGRILKNNGWYNAAIEGASLRTCPDYVDKKAVELKAREAYSKDKISKILQVVIGANAYCIKGSKMIVVIMDVRGFIDVQPVIILNEKGSFVGKFLLSAYGKKSWE